MAAGVGGLVVSWVVGWCHRGDVAAGCYWPTRPLVTAWWSYLNIAVSDNKMRKNEKKTLTIGPNGASGVVWARFRPRHLTSPFLSRIP